MITENELEIELRGRLVEHELPDATVEILEDVS